MGAHDLMKVSDKTLWEVRHYFHAEDRAGVRIAVFRHKRDAHEFATKICRGSNDLEFQVKPIKRKTL